MSQSTVFRGARKVDVEGVVDDFWMLVRGDTIAQVGAGAPPPADAMVDLTGRTITPGFIDLHCHGGGGHAFDDGDDEIMAALVTHRAHGTTRSVISVVSNPIAIPVSERTKPRKVAVMSGQRTENVRPEVTAESPRRGRPPALAEGLPASRL
ncbi:hypothetical protein FVA74_12195 [Salinibacterium sp. dk2585]|uniref:hypothetical protein n=1 Tax=unclassified Salinibacterium TaxID=2632331 RepID=UPI0011C244F4|nr:MULTISPECIES: hypothetical protein [unclassified Salinibacterium]QEE62252.1 hypothetical protein FVA74_12195 [Salinibacterium sp. dk2585]TXK53604.1 hypothetical protein FVP63_10465 [Salinibacterium sp. dk5596]